MSVAVEAADTNGALGSVLASAMGSDGRINIEHLKKMIQQTLLNRAGKAYFFKINSLIYLLI